MDVKTTYLYTMKGRLINVRLDEPRLERARRLRNHGITLSELVRDAIDRQYEQLIQSSQTRDVKSIMSEIYEKYPDPPGLPVRDYDVQDSGQARAAIRRRLRARHK